MRTRRVKMLASNAQSRNRTPARLGVCLALVIAASMLGPILIAPQPAQAQEDTRKKRAKRSKAVARKRAAAAESGEPEQASKRAPSPPGPAAPMGVPGAPSVPELKPFETGLDYQPTSPNAQVTFNLQDADLMDLVRLVSQITGKRFILPGTTRSIKATVYAPTKVTAAEAYQAFLSILELNGMAIVPAGRYLKLVESGRVEGRPIPLYTGDESVPVGDRFVTRLQHVKNIVAADAVTLLERFKSGDGSLTAYAPTNMLIVTDTGTNIHRMLRILDVIDVARTGEQIWVEPIHHASATDIVARLNEIFEPGAASGSAPAPATGRRGRAAPTPPPAPGAAPIPTVGSASVGETRLTKILADERTNSIIILATEPAYLRILEMLKYLDVSIDGEGHIHVHYLQHSDATDIASTLQGLVGSGGGKGAAATPGGSAIFSGPVSITAHKASNALVITASAHDYAAIRNVVDTLDTERKQVFIEAVIMELSVNRSSSLGTSFHGGVPDVPTDGSVSVLGFRAGNTIGGIIGGAAANPEVLTGLAVGVQGPELPGLSLPAFGVAINALSGSGDANILATPHLIATDNVEAEISVGQNVALQSSGGGLGNLGALAGLAGGQAGAGGLGALSGLAGLAGLGGTPRQDVGTTVTITPHINEHNEIRLQISEEISSAGAPSEQGQGNRDIDRTRAKTEVVARDQQTVVIGGLMRDSVTTAKTKVPVLGDLPLIGALFRSTTKQKVKKNLLLFLTPYVIRSPADLRSIYERKMRERQEFLDRYFVFGDSDYEPPVDYSRTRGLVAEIMLELKSLDEQKKLALDAASAPDQKHVPSDPVGAAPDGGGEGDVRIEPQEQGGAAPDSNAGDVVQQPPPNAAESVPAPPPPPQGAP